MSSFWNDLGTGTMFSAGGALVYGIFNTIFTHLSNRKKQAAEVKRAVAEVSEADVKIVAQYITINQELVEQNRQLINADSKSARAIGEYRRELNESRAETKDLKDVLRMVLTAMDQVIPLLQQQIADHAEMRQLNRTMAAARDRFNGHTT